MISETLREDVFAAESLWIIDARGSKKGGRFWREFGAVTESAFYQDVNEQRASILDNVIGQRLPEPSLTA